MRHILLGIAAIAAAQIAFQLLIVDDYAPEYAATIAPGAWRPDTIVTVRGGVLPANGRAGEPAALRVRLRKLPARSSEPIRATYRRPAPRIRQTLIAKIPARKPPLAARPDGPLGKDEDKDDKPWIAKALPIIKKPYSWLKALGAKLK